MIQEEKKVLIESLRYKGIRDERVLDAFRKVPRERFVAEPLRRYAYEDNALPIPCMQTISQPFTVAYMTMALNVQEGNKVLEVGSGSGYQAAILCELGAEVYTVERIEKLYKSAKELLESLGYKVNFKLGDGSKGWEEQAPYDRIIVTAGSPAVPQPLIEQLGFGKLVIPVGTLENQKLYEITKTTEGLGFKLHESFKFVPLIGEEGWRQE